MSDTNINQQPSVTVTHADLNFDNDLPVTEKVVNPSLLSKGSKLSLPVTIAPPSGLSKFLLLLGLILSIFLGSLDTTIVSTAIYVISSEFPTFPSLTTWISTSYLLTSTIMQPLFGNLSDIFGRKAILLFAIVTFCLGSLGCGLAESGLALILSRSLAGIGGGGLYPLSIIVISDIVPPKSRGMYLALAGGTFALASIAGPLIGGVFTDSVSWRWAFYINLPLCAITVITVIFFLKLAPTSYDDNDGKGEAEVMQVDWKQNLIEKVGRIDYYGAFTLTCFSLTLLLSLTWGSEENNWSSPKVISTLLLALISLISFIIVEVKFAKYPIVSKQLLKRNSIIATLNSFCIGALLTVLIYYLPIYYQVVKGTTATAAGLELLPLLLGAVSCNFVTGYVTLKTGLYCWMSQLGGLFQVLGCLLLSFRFTIDVTRVEEIIYILIEGLGLGLCFQNNTVIAQASVRQSDVASATSLVYFTNMLGGVVGLAVQGSIFSSQLLQNLNLLNITGLLTGEHNDVLPTLDTLRHLSAENLKDVRLVYVNAFIILFYTLIPYAVISFGCTLLLKHIPLRLANRNNAISVGHA